MNKRIGFVDHKLQNFHANVFLKNFRNELKSRGWTVAGCYSLDADDGGKGESMMDMVPTPGTQRNVDAYRICSRTELPCRSPRDLPFTNHVR